MPLSYRVHVLRRNLTAQFQSTGQAGRWLDRLGTRMFRAAQIEAGRISRTGTLVRGHRMDPVRGINQFACDVHIYNIAEHAAWVHGGTMTPIEPTTANNLSVPIARGSTVRHLRKSVRGQTANPWLDRACARVARSVGAVDYG
jgi:hypothetical protein